MCYRNRHYAYYALYVPISFELRITWYEIRVTPGDFRGDISPPKSPECAVPSHAMYATMQSPISIEGDGMSGERDYLSQVNYSKFIPPKINRHYLVRQRLMDRLDRADDHRFTLLLAPEGYGKSSLLSDWSRRATEGNKRTVLWFRVDERDANVSCFWDNFIELMNVAWPGIKSSFLGDELMSNYAYPAQMMISLANYIVQVSEPEVQYTFIFDNFHSFTMSESESLIILFAEMLPNNVNIVISSKAHRNNQIMDQDAYNKLLVIGVLELSMTRDETKELLCTSTAAQVSDTMIDTTFRKTEGWPLALYVMIEQIEAGKDVESCMREFSGNDYLLSDAVFSWATKKLPQRIMMFLLKTSFLERFNAELCDYVLEEEGSDEIILYLEDMGVFTFPADSTKTWYRYHGLFAEWLRDQALNLHRDKVRVLNHRACSWYRSHKRKLLAARHAIAASEGDFIVSLTKSVFFRSRITENRLLPWLFNLREDDLKQEPYFCLLASWAYAFSGRPNDARYWLSCAADHIKSGGVDSTGIKITSHSEQEGQVSPSDNVENRFDLVSRIILSKCSTLIGDTNQGIESSEQLLSVVDPMLEDMLKMVLFQNLGEAYELSGLLEKARKHYQKAMTLAGVNEFEFLVGLTRYQIIKVAIVEGRLIEAEKLCRIALLECPPDFTVYGALYSALVLVGVMQYKLDELESVLERAFVRVSPDRNMDMYLDTCIARGQYLMTRKNYTEALLQFAQARQAIVAHKDVPPRGVASLVFMAQVRLYIKLKDLESAEDLIREYDAIGFPWSAEGSLQRKTLEAQIMIEKGMVDESVLKELESLATYALEQKYIISLVEIYLLTMRAYHCLEQSSRAINFLRKALELSKHELIVRVFLDGDDVVRLLLIELIGSRNLGYETDKFARKLIAIFDESSSAGSEGSAEVSWTGESSENTFSFVDHWLLTTREREVLQLLVRGMNRKEIAVELCTSQNTVKTHISHIYEKMNVHSVSELLHAMVEHGVL